MTLILAHSWRPTASLKCRGKYTENPEPSAIIKIDKTPAFMYSILRTDLFFLISDLYIISPKINSNIII